jgi:hypothetical protein
MRACAVMRLLCICWPRTGPIDCRGNDGIRVFVKNVDGVYAELAARGVKAIKPPQNYDYGMHDFDVIDLDGNQLAFGMEALS